MNKNVLKINSTGELGEIWRLNKPEDMEVELQEPLRKSLNEGVIGFVTADIWTVVLVLGAVPGLKEWVLNKTYDVVFEYLKKAVSSKTILPPQISLKIECPQSGEYETIHLKGLSESITEVQVKIKKKYADGSQKDVDTKVKIKK